MQPDEFFNMLPAHYYAKVHGYNEKRKRDAELVRNSVWASLSSWEGSISYNAWCSKFFPMWYDKPIDDNVPELTQEQLQAHAERHKKIMAKSKSKKK